MGYPANTGIVLLFHQKSRQLKGVLWGEIQLNKILQVVWADFGFVLL
jgi:hypothetical protein